jgi:hypothetical protein
VSTWTNISGATSSSYSFTAHASDSGKKYRVLVSYKTGSACEAFSDIATLTVLSGPTVVAGDDQVICIIPNVQLIGTATNYLSAEWAIEAGYEGSGSIGVTSVDPSDSTKIMTTFTPTASSGNVTTTAVVKLTATAKPPCSGTVSDNLTIKVVQVPNAIIHVISPPGY